MSGCSLFFGKSGIILPNAERGGTSNLHEVRSSIKIRMSLAMAHLWRTRVALSVALGLLFFTSAECVSAQVPDLSTVVRGVDNSVKDRLDKVATYTVTEHYAVFRGRDRRCAARGPGHVGCRDEPPRR